jgi:hypothetical protein
MARPQMWQIPCKLEVDAWGIRYYKHYHDRTLSIQIKH